MYLFVGICLYIHTQNTTLFFSSSFFISSLIANNSPHQLNPIDEQRHRHRHSHHPHDITMTNEDSSLSGTPRSSAHNRSRQMPASYTYWINTGDNNNTSANANFMRLTYAASCRSRLSRSVERCPRACRGIFVVFFSLNIIYLCALKLLRLFVCVRVIAYLLCFGLKNDFNNFFLFSINQ